MNSFNKPLGWVVIGLALIAGLLTIPVFEQSASVSSGSLHASGNPLRTEVAGSGTFEFQSGWTISWTAATLCLLAFCGGILLVRSGTRQLQEAVAS